MAKSNDVPSLWLQLIDAKPWYLFHKKTLISDLYPEINLMCRGPQPILPFKWVDAI